MTTAVARSLSLAGRRYPVVLPSLRDPRLHLASVIVSIHVLGQTALGFRVSVPQILSAVATCALLEVGWTFLSRRQIVWPASAMLTGSGVALILRIVDQGRGEHWTWRGWHLFALVAGGSLLSKYLIRFRGSHVFNPSNLGLVVAFLVLGSSRIEPLDFWWAPLGLPMLAAYVVIVVGGLLITRRLRLLPMALTFWSALALALGALAASGHCLTAAWAVEPVCGTEFWSVVVTSPEVLVFLFFMITDPKTIPLHGRGRVLFAASVAVVSTLLIAPQTTEFGAKVGLLAGLVILTPFRGLFDTLGERARGFLTAAGSVRAFGRGAALGSLATVLVMAIVWAGTPARLAVPAAPPSASLAEVRVDLSGLPPVSVSAEASALQGAQDPLTLAEALLESLAIERQAMLRSDTSLLRSAAGGERLLEMERAVEAAATSGRLETWNPRFESLRLDVVYLDGPQGGASLSLEARGVAEVTLHDRDGRSLSSTEESFHTLFVLRPEGGRWVIVSARPV